MDEWTRVNGKAALGSWDIEYFKTAVVRTPLAFAYDLSPTEHAGLELQELCPATALIDKALAALDDPRISLAMLHAAEGLNSRLGRLRDPSTVLAERVSLAFSVYKYLARAVRRSTPFGLMAGIATASVAGECSNLHPLIDDSVYTRIDGRVLEKISGFCETTILAASDSELGMTLVRLNPTIVLLRGVYRYTYVDRSTENFALSTRSLTKSATRLLQSSNISVHFVPVSELVSSLLASGEFTSDAAYEFARGCIRDQILTTELRPSISGGALRSLLSCIERFPSLREVRSCVGELESITRRTTSIANFRSLYERVYEVAHERASDAGLAQKEKNLLYVELLRASSGLQVGRSVAAEVTQDLRKLLPLMWHENLEAKSLALAIEEKFGAGRWVPILRVCDPDAGVQVGPKRNRKSPLIEGLGVVKAEQSEKVTWTSLDEMLLRIISSSTPGNEEVELTEADVHSIGRNARTPELAIGDTYSLILNVLDSGPDVRCHFAGLFGPSSARILGRFTEGSVSIKTVCESMDRREAELAGQLTAEVMFGSDPILLNIASRESIRLHEIVCGSYLPSGRAEGHLELDDLLVSSEFGRISLFSKKLEAAILPRLSTAHYSGGYSSPIYRMLHLISSQAGEFSLKFFGNPVANSLSYIPRIRFGSLILGLRSWRIESWERDMLNGDKAFCQLHAAVLELRERRGFPRLVSVAEADNVLDFDLDDSASALAFGIYVWQSKADRVTESLWLPSEGGRDRHYANEVVIPVSIRHPGREWIAGGSPIEGATVSADGCSTAELLGDWISMELDIGISEIDGFLVEEWMPAVKARFKDHGSATWFFVRYSREGRSHLRLRVKDAFSGWLIALVNLWVRRGVIDDARVTCYVPEYERYGGLQGMEACHAIFHESSMLSMLFLQSGSLADGQEDERWIFALRLLFLRLKLCFGRLEDAISFCRAQGDALLSSLQVEVKSKSAVSAGYRKQENFIESAGSIDMVSIIDKDVIDDCAKRFELLQRKSDSKKIPGIVASLIHMDCNRLFPSYARENEMMLYRYAERAIRSRLARGLPLL
ncbi:thiopeptide-type bacteriocin biosynthesis protein [Pseudoxanthomonas sp.]|uniref:thiopeptide-type bacteriocin biosynthesis protein n=1 Tax=Pseudoxanthomonas sp. TaxID=1871049 RepID=UPI0025E78381|nr:thiopeptide-type bacteriocin biosynthesis protein [Pseudoxanthomonas sp.]